jgi:phosphatidylserine synthase
MSNLQRLQFIACICTIANFSCGFFGINAESLRQSIEPQHSIETEFIAKG